MREIRLSNGKGVTLVDDDVAELVGGRPVFRHSAGYATTEDDDGRLVLLHRWILGLTDPCIQTDHRNGDRLDNRRCNLRIATPAENARNARKRSTPASSRFKGVSHVRKCPVNPWQAQIHHDGRTYWLGQFETEEAAARAYDAAARRLAGEFARLNFPAQGAA